VLARRRYRLTIGLDSKWLGGNKSLLIRHPPGSAVFSGTAAEDLEQGPWLGPSHSGTVWTMGLCPLRLYYPVAPWR
jgi:hypothetical protein